jgi:hypothetical protein
MEHGVVLLVMKGKATAVFVLNVTDRARRQKLLTE